MGLSETNSLSLDTCLRGYEYSRRRKTEKKCGKLKHELKKAQEEIAWLRREKEVLEEEAKLPF